jgi:hypothetical protein
MKRARSYLALLLSLLLVLTAMPVYAADEQLAGESGDAVSDSYVRLKNKWKSNYLYEDSSGIVRYGFPSYEDESAQWKIEDYNGNKRIRNRATGHYITITDVTQRRDALTAREITTSTNADQWTIHESNRPGYVVIKSATVPSSANLVIHQEDQLGFAEASNDINITFESPQWAIEPVEEEIPVRLANKFREGQYLYEAADGFVDFGDKKANDASSHWILEEGDTPNTKRLKNRATGHYITQGVFWEPIKALATGIDTKSEWLMEDASGAGYITFKNIEALNTSSGTLTYVLNTQFPDDTHVRSNDWSNPGLDNAQWRMELAPDALPYRIAGFTIDPVSTTYLFDDEGVVSYGALTTIVGDKTYYQWVTEDYDGKQRLRNLATGRYISRAGNDSPEDPLHVLNLSESTIDDQWTLARSTLYDDYKTIESKAAAGEFLNIKDAIGAAQAGDIDPNVDSAQWLFEDPAFSGDGTPQYVRIRNEWQPFYFYEDDNGQLKYGNIAEDDEKGQWLVERFHGRKRIQNRATGHYIHIENMENGRISVSDVEDSWTSAVWVIEDFDGTKLIHSVQDANDVVGQQKYLSLQNLTKYVEYGVINPSWGSPRWKFEPVGEAGPTNVRIKNKLTNDYLYEVTEAGDDLGKVKYGDLTEEQSASVWYLEKTGDSPNSIRLKNVSTNHYVSMEHVSADVELDAPPQQIVAQDGICLCWGSAKWMMEPGTSDDTIVLKSGWAGHYLYADGEGYTKVSKLVVAEDSAQYVLEPVVMEPEPLYDGPIRIVSMANGKFLYENSGGIVLYGDVDESNGYGHWYIEDNDGVQRLRNRVTGHYMSMKKDMTFIESKEAEEGDLESEWAIEAVPGTLEYVIRSLNGYYNDELINVQNNAGYAERGLFPIGYGSVKWGFQYAPEEFDTPDMSEGKVYDTATPIFNDTNYVTIQSKATSQYMYLEDGTLLTGTPVEGDAGAQWLQQDFNGRKLIRNKESGQLLAVDDEGNVSLDTDAKGNDAAQWYTEDRLGYKLIGNASDRGGLLQYTDNGVKHGSPSGMDDAMWTLAPVRSDVRYEAEQAFFGGGAEASDTSKGFTGDGYMDGFTTNGAKISFTVNAPEAGSYDVALRYMSASSAERTLSVYVNGLPVSQAAFGKATAWTELVLELGLRAGINTITLQKNAADTGRVKLDSLTVRNSVGINYRGATVPYVSYEAEHAVTNGEVLEPSRLYKEIASEASGRSAVKLDAEGEYVEFTLAKAANSIVLRYVIPDSEDGAGLNETLALYVNGEFKQHLSLSSKHGWEYGSYPWSNDPNQGNAHRFFDEIHALIGDVPAGATIRLQKDAGNEADYYVIDLADMEQVEDALTKPDGFLSVTDFGAVAGDGDSDMAAFEETMAAAKQQGMGVWFPAGVFHLGEDNIDLSQITIRGAGMWYTTLIGAKFIGKGSDVQVYDLLIDGDLNIRDDEALTHAFYGGYGTGSVIQNVWVEHSKTGLWLSKVRGGTEITDELHMVNLRLRNLMADGINFSVGTSNSLMEQSDIRYPGDDGLAMWSAEGLASVNNTARFNTVALPWLADNFVIFGGQDNKLQDNIGTDTITNGAGIAVSTRFNPVPFTGTTVVERNTLIRTGSADSAYNINLGAIWLFAGEKDLNGHVIVRDNVALDSTYAGLIVHGGGFGVDNLTLQNVVLDGMGTNGIDVTGNLSGTIDVDNVIVRGERIRMIADANPNFAFEELNDGFANLQKPFSIKLENGDTGPLRMTAGERKELQVLGAEGVDVTDDAAFAIETASIASIGSDHVIRARSEGVTKLSVLLGGDLRIFTIEVEARDDEGQGGSGGGSIIPDPPVTETVDTKQNDAKLTEAASANEDRIVFTIDSAKPNNGVSFSGAALLEAGKKNADAVIVIEFDGASYELPLSFVTSQLGTLTPEELSKVVWTLNIKPVELAIKTELEKRGEEQGLELIGEPIDFTIIVTNGNTKTEIRSFGGRYVKRTLTAKGDIDTKDAVALVYDPGTGKFHYVPAVIESAEGMTHADIMSMSNSIYVLASNAKSFDDTKGHWAQSDIEQLAARQILSGITASSFAPQRSVTRAEFATMLVRALGLHGAGNGTGITFSDVAKGTWYEEAVVTAASYGLVKGNADGRFRPLDTITREQMAVMVANALTFAANAGLQVKQAADPSGAASFRDESAIHAWALDSVKRAAAVGIIVGKGKAGIFAPLDPATRAEAAVIIKRLLQVVQLMK